MSGRTSKAKRGRDPQRENPEARRRFVKTLAQVLGVQVITLVLLWLLQTHFSY
jgi:hypothetical protein